MTRMPIPTEPEYEETITCRLSTALSALLVAWAVGFAVSCVVFAIIISRS